MNKRIGAVILAAGFARRMGRQKLLLPLGDRPLLAHILSVVAGMTWADCIAVIGEPLQELSSLCTQYHIRFIYNPERQTGQASSIQLALRQLSVELDGILFMPGDQPFLSSLLLKALVARFATLDNQRIVVPEYRGQRYSPTLFGAWWRPQLLALTGDGGGRVLLRENPTFVTTVDWEDGDLFQDADTWEEYQMMSKQWQERNL